MTNHVKPTPQELEANAQKALADIEAMKEKENAEIPKEETKVEETEEKKEEVSKEEENTEEKKTVIPKEKEEATEEDEKKTEETNYKKKFANSSREAQIQSSLNKKMAEALEKAANPPEPTAEELVKKYPGWEEMSDFERNMAKSAYMNDLRFTGINEVTKEFKDFDTWKQSVDTFVEDPQTLIENPLLEGKEEDFKLFSLKEKHQGADFSLLVSAFLSTVEKEKPKNKGKMFETGTGGSNEKAKPKSDKITIEQSRVLRETDYNKWKEYVKAGKIESLE